ncbi:CNP1-like family protein [Undibacterium sp. RuRC25W]|uniref:CNP1-like family protein n=1 Tax=Undibacterium sp. RuRC25W TaxID=3413047 RepID=UPI003BF1118A
MHYFKQISLSSFKRLLGQSLWVSAALLSSATLCHAGQATQTASPPDETEKTWTEVALELPPAPKPENLVFFYKGSNLSFAIDKPSVSVASDGTVRYTLIASNNSGAKNISYEAIRCETYEHKLYAFGRADGTWSRSRRNEWDRISNTGVNKQHHILFTEFFCDGTTVAGKAPYLVNRLQGQGSSSVNSR